MSGSEHIEFENKRVSAESIVSLCKAYYDAGEFLGESAGLRENANMLRYLKTEPKKGACFITPQGLFLYGAGLDHMNLLKAIGLNGEDDSVVREKKWIRCDSGLSTG